MLQPIETEDQYTCVLSYAYEIMQTDFKQNLQATSELDILCLQINEYISSACSDDREME